jgi:hypothetical protein
LHRAGWPRPPREPFPPVRRLLQSITLVARARRAALVAGLAVALVGSVAVGWPTDVSAAPMTCSQAIRMAQVYYAAGEMYEALQKPMMAAYYYGQVKGVLAGAC